MTIAGFCETAASKCMRRAVGIEDGGDDHRFGDDGGEAMVW